MSQLSVNIDINDEKLQQCVSKILNERELHITSRNIETIDCKKLNFTTGGIYRLHGFAETYEKEISWSFIIKIIQPEHQEKDNPQHHNYWKREALVNQSGILKRLPPVIHTPECYAVEEKSDGTVWLWMEEIKGDNDCLWSEKEFTFIARQLGLFNGAYVTGSVIPDEPWICHQWLTSWVLGCKKYASEPLHNYSLIQGQNEKIDQIWKKYMYLNSNIEKHLHFLSKLPRVLAHQDLSQRNMYVQSAQHKEQKLTLIDWQFMSISGMGEDLGKLYGIAMSQNRMPLELYTDYKELLFANYLEGLKLAGWNGDVALPRYGFCASVALRSVWEVPQLMQLLASSRFDAQGNTSNSKVQNLIQIVSIQMDLAEEADLLLNKEIANEEGKKFDC